MPPAAARSEGSSRRTSRMRSFRLTLIGGCVSNDGVDADPVDGPGGVSCDEAAELTRAGGGGGGRIPEPSGADIFKS